MIQQIFNVFQSSVTCFHMKIFLPVISILSDQKKKKPQGILIT